MDGIQLVNLSGFCTALGVELFLQADGSVLGRVTLRKEQEGPPFHVHGGVLAALIDEAMGAAAWASGKRAVSVKLTCNYRKPVPLDVPLHITGCIERSEGRKHFTAGSISLPSGETAAEGSAIFIEAPQIFEGLRNPFAHVPDQE